MPSPASSDLNVPLTHRMLHGRPYRAKSARFDFPRAARFLRRSRLLRLLLVLPLFYVSALLMCVGTFSFAGIRPIPGSVYRSGVAFAMLWPEMQADGGRNSTSPAPQVRFLIMTPPKSKVCSFVLFSSLVLCTFMFDATSYILYQSVQLVLSWSTLLNAMEVLVLHFVNCDSSSLLIPLFKIAEKWNLY